MFKVIQLRAIKPKYKYNYTCIRNFSSPNPIDKHNDEMLVIRKREQERMIPNSYKEQAKLTKDTTKTKDTQEKIKGKTGSNNKLVYGILGLAFIGGSWYGYRKSKNDKNDKGDGPPSGTFSYVPSTTQMVNMPS